VVVARGRLALAAVALLAVFLGGVIAHVDVASSGLAASPAAARIDTLVERPRDRMPPPPHRPRVMRPSSRRPR
jgi:hypothetical protein